MIGTPEKLPFQLVPSITGHFIPAREDGESEKSVFCDIVSAGTFFAPTSAQEGSIKRSTEACQARTCFLFTSGEKRGSDVVVVVRKNMKEGDVCWINGFVSPLLFL